MNVVVPAIGSLAPRLVVAGSAEQLFTAEIETQGDDDLALAGWSRQVYERAYHTPNLAWEYHDGEGWRSLGDDFVDKTLNLAKSGVITFTVPPDLRPTDVAGQTDYWIRARLIGGDYGRPRYLVKQKKDDKEELIVEQTVEVDTSGLRPPEIARIEASFDRADDVTPQHLITRNNLGDIDQAGTSAIDKAFFRIFEGPGQTDLGAGTDRSLLIGLTRPLTPGRLTLLADVVETPGMVPLLAESLTVDGWRPAGLIDSTKGLGRTGLLHIAIDAPPARVSLMGHDLFWLKLRPRQAGVTWAPVLKGLHLNAVTAHQAETVEHEPLGASLGEPDFTVTLAKPPVLAGSLELRVRERLNAEDREAMLAQATPDQPAPVATYDIPGLEGDWVLWRQVDSFADQDGDARVYRLNPTTGVVTFGDALNGRVPPAGADLIRAIRYQSGGQAIDLPAFAAARPRSSIEAVEEIVSPLPIAGGTAPPTADVLAASLPLRLRHAGAALSLADVEAMALAHDRDLTQAVALPRDAAASTIRLIVVSRDPTRLAKPSLARMEALERTLGAAVSYAFGPESVEVRAAGFFKIIVTVGLVAEAGQGGSLEDAARARLAEFLDPAIGGPKGEGWPIGRPIWKSDIYRVLDDLPGLVLIERLDITPLDPIADIERLAQDQVIAADLDNIEVVVVREVGP